MRHRLHALALGLALATYGSVAPCEPTPGVTQTDAVTKATVMRTAGWVTIGTGVAAAAGAGTLSYLASERNQQIRDDANAGRTPDSADRSARDRLSIGAVVLSGVSVVAVGTGIGLLVLAPSNVSEQAFQVRVTAGGLMLSGAY